MAIVSRSPRRFFQRIGYLPTYAGPIPLADMSQLGNRDYPVAPSTIPSEHRLGQDGIPSPDRGLTGEWPYNLAETAGG